jgi:hypothetical protein
MCSLFALASIIFFARFMERRRWQDSFFFGLFLGVALLTKNSTFFVALVVPLMIVGARKWELLRNRAFWLGPVVAGCLYIPWLIVSRPFLLLGFHGLQVPGFLGTQREFLGVLWRETSFLLLAAAGAVFLLRAKERLDAVSLSMLAIIPAMSIATYAARVVVQDRFMIVSYCAIIFLATSVCTAVLGRAKAAVAMFGCLAVFGAMNWMHFSPPPADRIGPAVAFLHARDQGLPGAVLVPSAGEGQWIAKFAETETQRPARILVRPTKLFGKEDWNGSDWRPYYHSVDELKALFERIPIRYCILSGSAKARKYRHDELLQSVVSDSQSWQPVFQGGTGNSPDYRIYENKRWQPESEKTVYREISLLWAQHLP